MEASFRDGHGALALPVRQGCMRLLEVVGVVRSIRLNLR